MARAGLIEDLWRGQQAWLVGLAAIVALVAVRPALPASVDVPPAPDAHDFVVRYCVQAHFSNGTISQPLCSGEWGKILPYESPAGPSDTRHPFQTIGDCWQSIDKNALKNGKQLARDAAGRYHAEGFNPAKLSGTLEEYFECVSLSAEERAEATASKVDDGAWVVHVFARPGAIGYYLTNRFKSQADCEAFLVSTPPKDGGLSYDCEQAGINFDY
jgi:hypothetical protein